MNTFACVEHGAGGETIPNQEETEPACTISFIRQQSLYDQASII